MVLKMIKVAYNYQTFTEQKYGGISRMFSEIATRVDLYNDFDVQIYAGIYQNYYLANNRNVRKKGFPLSYPSHLINSSYWLRFFLFINSIFAKIALGIAQPDIVHETYYGSINTVPKKSKVVITVLDMVHEKFIDSMGNKKFSVIKANSIKRADHVICISENTKKDLIEILNINPDKISVVYLGYAIGEKVSDESVPIINSPYILYVGIKNQQYKNFERLLKAYGNSKKIQDNFKLVCFGPQPFSPKELELMHYLGVSTNNFFHYGGDDKFLANLYTHATAFIYPSLYEGFGIPPLEAMSFNCPVVCSNVSSIPEIVGNAGEYFDPYSVKSMIEAMEKVLFSVDIQEDLIQKGQERVRLFSWEKCATETALVYQKLMRNV
jgi:glycosyltransferase involved in cell wall biosynthesis